MFTFILSLLKTHTVRIYTDNRNNVCRQLTNNTIVAGVPFQAEEQIAFMDSPDYDLSAEESQFVAVYGRRRVGKTFLIREAFDYNFVFQHTGTYGEDILQTGIAV